MSDSHFDSQYENENVVGHEPSDYVPTRGNAPVKTQSSAEKPQSKQTTKQQQQQQQSSANAVNRQSGNPPQHASHSNNNHNSNAINANHSRVQQIDEEQRLKLIEQNRKLKDQLRELAKAMDDILYKEKEQKYQKYGQHEEDEELKQKKRELRDQQIEIQNLRQQIQQLKRQLENTYDINKIVQKEDELQYWQNELQKQLAEKESLIKIRNEQQKALKYLNNDEEYTQKLSTLRDQLSRAKQEHRDLAQQLLEKENALRKSHEQLVTKEEKIKELQQRIKDKKAGKLQGDLDNLDITEEMVQELEEKTKELEEEKKRLERNFAEQIKQIERERRELQVEHEKKLLILKEREKELKLNQIKIKEITRLIRNNAIAEQQQKKVLQLQQQQMQQQAEDAASNLSEALHIGGDKNTPKGFKIKKQPNRSKPPIQVQATKDKKKQSVPKVNDQGEVNSVIGAEPAPKAKNARRDDENADKKEEVQDLDLEDIDKELDEIAQRQKEIDDHRQKGKRQSTQKSKKDDVDELSPVPVQQNAAADETKQGGANGGEDAENGAADAVNVEENVPDEVYGEDFDP